MSRYAVTKEAAQAVLAQVLANPMTKTLPAPSIKRVDDPYFTSDDYYLVWPNGFHVPVAALAVSIKFHPRWDAGLMLEYQEQPPPMEGTSEGIRWKD